MSGDDACLRHSHAWIVRRWANIDKPAVNEGGAQHRRRKSRSLLENTVGIQTVPGPGRAGGGEIENSALEKGHVDQVGKPQHGKIQHIAAGGGQSGPVLVGSPYARRIGFPLAAALVRDDQILPVKTPGHVRAHDGVGATSQRNDECRPTMTGDGSNRHPRLEIDHPGEILENHCGTGFLNGSAAVVSSEVPTRPSDESWYCSLIESPSRTSAWSVERKNPAVAGGVFVPYESRRTFN